MLRSIDCHDQHDPGKSLELADQLDGEAQFVFIQAKLNAMRLDIDQDAAWKSIVSQEVWLRALGQLEASNCLVRSLLPSC